MLSGKVAHQMDGKNRIRIPAKFRNAFPKGEALYYVEYGTGCVSVMPESVLNQKLALFNEADPGDPEMMNAKRRILSSVEELSEDGQGRTQIPRPFRLYASLEKDVITVGMGNYVEIWAAEKFETDVGSMSIQQANQVAYKKRSVQ